MTTQQVPTIFLCDDDAKMHDHVHLPGRRHESAVRGFFSGAGVPRLPTMSRPGAWSPSCARGPRRLEIQRRPRRSRCRCRSCFSRPTRPCRSSSGRCNAGAPPTFSKTARRTGGLEAIQTPSIWIASGAQGTGQARHQAPASRNSLPGRCRRVLCLAGRGQVAPLDRLGTEPVRPDRRTGRAWARRNSKSTTTPNSCDSRSWHSARTTRRPPVLRKR